MPLVDEVEPESELLEGSDEFIVLLVVEVELETELFEVSDGFVVPLVVEVESEVELLVDSDIFVVPFDIESELAAELLDVLSLCDISGGADTLSEVSLLLLQAVAERHSITVNKAAIFLFIFYPFLSDHSRASETSAKSLRISSFCGQCFSHLPHFTQSDALPCDFAKLL